MAFAVFHPVAAAVVAAVMLAAGIALFALLASRIRRAWQRRRSRRQLAGCTPVVEGEFS
jgi:cytochrome bd-type quinol oxidase subunit 1